MSITYTIGDLAKEFDLTTRAMRFYEDMGLLQPERTGPGGRNRFRQVLLNDYLRVMHRTKMLSVLAWHLYVVI